MNDELDKRISALHDVAKRAYLDIYLREVVKETWNIVDTPPGLECQDQDGNAIGSVTIEDSPEAAKPP